jgi:hypothetical protein
MKKTIFCLIIFTINLPAAAIGYNDFPPDLQPVLNEISNSIKSDGGICVAGRIKMSDGAPIGGGEDVMINLYGGIDAPLWVYEGGWFMMEPNLMSHYTGRNNKLVLRAFGYEPIDASINAISGEMTYAEFVMHKVPDENLATVTGTVFNDQNEPFEGVHVLLSFPFANHGYRGDIGETFPSKKMTTGSDGKYSFEGLSLTGYSLVASASGYAYHSVYFTPAAGEPVIKDLKLYRDRGIVIDYVYQADGSRSFTDGELQTGTIEWVNGHEGVDFSDGKAEGYEQDSLRDIEMRQDKDVLKFQIFYVNGKNGFYDAGEVDFESVTEAALTSYPTTAKPCVVGHTYVVRTYEGNYAKFVVRSISGSE